MRLLAGLGLILAGCATINPHYYETMPTAQICAQLMSFPSWNLNQGARYRELERRGASCGHPGDIAASQRAAEQQLGNSLSTIDAVTRQPPPPPAPRVNCILVNNVMTCR